METLINITRFKGKKSKKNKQMPEKSIKVLKILRPPVPQEENESGNGFKLWIKNIPPNVIMIIVYTSKWIM